MSKTTYPKGSFHPSGRVGETETSGARNWESGSKTEYKVPTVADTAFYGHKNNTLLCQGASGSKTAKDYPKKSRKFDCEGFR